MPSTDAGLQPIVVKFNRLDPLSSISHIKWNSFSRIVASQSTLGPPFLWGASPAAPRNITLEQRELTIDGMAGTWMPQYSDAPGHLDFLRYDVTNLAYYARHSGRAAVIGVGSGRDILSAHLFGFRDITGVELNPIFIDLLTDPPSCAPTPASPTSRACASWSTTAGAGSRGPRRNST